MLDPNTEDYPLQVNQPEELESLTLENQHKTRTLELVTNLEKTSDSDFYATTDPIEVVRKCSPKQGIKEDIKENRQTTGVCVLNEPISFTDEEYSVPSDNATNVVEYTIPFKGTIPATELIEVGFSTESTSICHTFSPATNTILMPPAEQNAEVRETINLSPQLQKVDAYEHPQETVREPWVVVKMEELLDFKEEPEERPLRPASLNQDAEVQDEQKAEEELVERASVCSTLSDPQLAAKSSSETSTPEELRTYEDSSSGVESHSDDAPTSLQTTLTPDPDLGIHMGQEEGTDTPAGTPASNNKGIPLPLQIVDIEGQSQSTSPSGISDSSEINPIVRKKKMTASTESKEHDYEQRDKEKGAQRGNDD
ncbi:unnamed protein product [Ranitomeya imitator]|uniref:Uncharacterized protein n=1 Tax=Ranitomeya imitator TaxID=111125 RepID=A0ABN9M151_9NEOB|nr:unnamed protein product [Ranitomeya imitator]